jgi:hypothetical protein
MALLTITASGEETNTILSGAIASLHPDGRRYIASIAPLSGSFAPEAAVPRIQPAKPDSRNVTLSGGGS